MGIGEIFSVQFNKIKHLANSNIKHNTSACELLKYTLLGTTPNNATTESVESLTLKIFKSVCCFWCMWQCMWQWSRSITTTFTRGILFLEASRIVFGLNVTDAGFETAAVRVWPRLRRNGRVRQLQSVERWIAIPLKMSPDLRLYLEWASATPQDIYIWRDLTYNIWMISTY